MQMMTDAIGIETATEGVEGTGRDQGAERENGDVTEAEKGSDADTGPLHPQWDVKGIDSKHYKTSCCSKQVECCSQIVYSF